MTRLPVALAYFTSDPQTSEPLSLVIKKPEKEAGASINFTDPFIEEGGSTMLMAMAMGARSFEVMSTDAMSIVFSQPPPPPETIEALITLEEGLDAGDLYVPSIELHLEDRSTLALSGELNEEGNLVAGFSRAEIASWFEGAAGKLDQVTFKVTGEGYEEGIYRFLFTGQATILLVGKYLVEKIAILGPDAFLIPSPGESVAVPYQLINQDLNPLEEAITWDLATPHQGVEIDRHTGKITVQGYAPEGSLTVTAEVESQRRTHYVEKTITLCQDPGLSIMGVQEITIPQPGETTSAMFHLVANSGATFDDVTWEIDGDTAGVIVDRSGNVFVDSTAKAENFTLVARTNLLGIPLAAETTVALEKVIYSGSTVPAEIPGDPVQSPADPVKISGDSFILIPVAGASTNHTYTATDLAGNPLTGLDWNIQDAIDGVELADSTLTVSADASGGTIVLQATLEQPGEKEGEVTLLTGRKFITLALPAPSGVKVNGPGTLTIPAPDQNDGLTTISRMYRAEVLDQKGNMLDGETVTWELSGPHQGVSLGANGELTVTSLAVPGTITLVARSVTNTDLVGTITVDLAGGGDAPRPGGGGGGSGEPKDVNKDDEVPDHNEDPTDVREPEEDDDVINDNDDSQEDEGKPEDPGESNDPDPGEPGRDDDQADHGDQPDEEASLDPVDRRDGDGEIAPGDDTGGDDTPGFGGDTGDSDNGTADPGNDSPGDTGGGDSGADPGSDSTGDNGGSDGGADSGSGDSDTGDNN